MKPVVLIAIAVVLSVAGTLAVLTGWEEVSTIQDEQQKIKEIQEKEERIVMDVRQIDIQYYNGSFETHLEYLCNDNDWECKIKIDKNSNEMKMLFNECLTKDFPKQEINDYEVDIADDIFVTCGKYVLREFGFLLTYDSVDPIVKRPTYSKDFPPFYEIVTERPDTFSSIGIFSTNQVCKSGDRLILYDVDEHGGFWQLDGNNNWGFCEAYSLKDTQFSYYDDRD